MALDKERERYYEDLNETFRTQGWEKHIMEDVLQRYETNSKQLNHDLQLEQRQLWQLQGAQTVLKSLLDYEKILNLIKDNDEQEAEAVAEDEEELDAEAVV